MNHTAGRHFRKKLISQELPGQLGRSMRTEELSREHIALKHKKKMDQNSIKWFVEFCII